MTSQQDIKEKLLEMIRNERSIHEIMELVTSWKDKEVKKAISLHVIDMIELEAQKKKSLQSQGGK